MKSILKTTLFIIMMVVMSTTMCFATTDVNIKLSHKINGTPPDNARVYFEFEPLDDAPMPDIPRVDMTHKTKSTFVIPLETQGLYKYRAYKRTLLNGQEMISDEKYDIEILLTNTGEQIVVMTKGDGKEKSIEYESLFIDPAQKTRKGGTSTSTSRTNTQTGDNIVRAYCIVGIAGLSLILLLIARFRKRRRVDDFDI